VKAETTSGSDRLRGPAYRFAHADYTIEQVAPERVDGDG